MATEMRSGTIFIPRPLHEIAHCVTHFELPSLQLLARLVTTCVKAIFRWHFYETDSVIVRNYNGYIHAFNGPVELETKPQLIYDCSVKFIPSQDVRFEFTPLEAINPFSLENVLTHFRKDLDILCYDKCFTFTDLLNNQKFQRV